MTIDDFEILKVIGKGGYASVVMARKKDSGLLYAIKIMDKKHLLTCMTPSAIVREVQINRKLKKSNFVIDLYWAFQNKTKLFLVMDLCVGGQLFYFLSQRDKLTEEMALFYTVEVMEALEILHAENMLYRDLKPENILIGADGHVKLADFGLSKELRRGDEYSTTFCGSPEYLCPEMLNGKPHNKTMDYYTLGCLLYEMICGFPPFYSHSKKEIMEGINFKEVDFPLTVSDDCQDLVRWLLQKNPDDRPQSWEDIRSHIFFRGINWKKVKRGALRTPWKPSLMTSHFNPKFTSMDIKEEMRQLGVEESRTSFYYEKVAGRQEGKSVYRLSKKGGAAEEDFEFDLAKGKMYIKEFDFTEMPQKELDIEETLRRFQDRDFFDSEPLVRHALRVPIKRKEETESSSSIAKEGSLYMSTVEKERSEQFSKYTMQSESTDMSARKKDDPAVAQTPKSRKKHIHASDEKDVRGDSEYTHNSGPEKSQFEDLMHYEREEKHSEERKFVESEDYLEMDETDELTSTEVKTVRQINFKTRIFNSEDQNKPKKHSKGKLNFAASRRSEGLSLAKATSEHETLDKLMPERNFFLEKKRKHEEELSQMTNSTFNSEGKKPRKKRPMYWGMHSMPVDKE